MSYVLVTGANGFIGHHLCQALHANSDSVRAVVRRAGNIDKRFDEYVVDTIDKATSWKNALKNIDCVVHLAARVHIMNDTSADPIEAFRSVNTYGTLNLARQAAEQGVKRFIYISSIKVNGENTVSGKSFSADDIPNPSDPYGVSKYEAEQQLMILAENSGIEVVIIRPPLVYGPGVRGNFLRMMEWLDKGIPLPLGAVRNKRSVVGVENLVNLILTCLSHKAAANQVFLVSDRDVLSTTELMQKTARALGRPARLLPVPQWVLELAMKLLGKRSLSQRLCGSLQVDINKTKELLDWAPPYKFEDGLHKTVEWYTNQQS